MYPKFLNLMHLLFIVVLAHPFIEIQYCILTYFNVGNVPENREAFSGSSEDDAGRSVHGQRREHLQDHHKTDHRDSGEGLQRL